MWCWTNTKEVGPRDGRAVILQGEIGGISIDCRHATTRHHAHSQAIVATRTIDGRRIFALRDMMIGNDFLSILCLAMGAVMETPMPGARIDNRFLSG